MGVIPPVPDPPRYRAFTITPSGNPKPSWAIPTVKESRFPQSSLITELSDLQEKDKSSIADKIARLSEEQKASVLNVLVEVIAEDEDGGKGAGDRLEVEERREWSVCEAVRVRGSKGRTRYVRVFLVKAPVPFMDKGEKRMGSEVSSRVSGASGTSRVSKERKGSEAGSALSGKGKGKEVANTSRSRSRGKEKEEKEENEKAVEKASRERRKSTREKEPSRESKGKGKEIERVEEKKIKRRSWKSRHRKKDYDDEEEEDSCSCGSDSTISLKSHTRGLRRSKPRELSHRFKSRRSEVNPLSYGKAEEKWEPPAIIPPQYPVRGYPQPQAQANEYHIRAAYEAGQRDALAERLRNATLDRRDLPQGPSHVISFERLRPGFEEWSEESYSPGGREPERYVERHRPPIVQYPRHVNPNHIPPSYVGTQYGGESYFETRPHADRRYSGDIRMDSSYEQYRPDNFRRRYTAY